MSITEFRIRNRAEKLYANDCKERGAMMQGGFGFLNKEAQAPWLQAAAEQIIDEEEQEEELRNNGQFGVGA